MSIVLSGLSHSLRTLYMFLLGNTRKKLALLLVTEPGCHVVDVVHFAFQSESDCAAIGKVLRNCECQCLNSCPGPGQVQNPSSCRCACPSIIHFSSCPSGVVDELNCQCAVPLPSKYCCLTTVPDFTPYAGTCWRHQDEASCMLEPGGKCQWSPLECLPSPPTNTLNRLVPCAFRDMKCTTDSDCCSEVCRLGGFCR